MALFIERNQWSWVLHNITIALYASWKSVHVICWKERIIKGSRDQDAQDTQRIDAYFDWRERGELNEGIFFRDSLKNYDKTKSH